MNKIGYLGPTGSFTEQALIDFCKIYDKYAKSKNKELTKQPITSIPEILLMVSNGKIELGIAPIENLLEGAVSSTLDLLAQKDIYINCDFPMSIKQCLLGNHSSKDRINTIISHPQGIGQCSNYILNNFPNSKIMYANSTSEAARIVAASKEDNIAAISSNLAAHEFGLQIIEEDIQDIKNNFTRFICVSRSLELLNEEIPDTLYKTSIVFSTENTPGSLYNVLNIFNLWDINLTKIESRPSKTNLGEYIFFADVQGKLEDDNIQDALKMIRRKTSFYKILGCFPSLDYDFMASSASKFL